MPLTTKGKATARRALMQRRKKQPKHVDNSTLIAGSPMYFYCISCGHLADEKPENYVTSVRKLCKECEALKEMGWLD